MLCPLRWLVWQRCCGGKLAGMARGLLVRGPFASGLGWALGHTRLKETVCSRPDGGIFHHCHRAPDLG